MRLTISLVVGILLSSCATNAPKVTWCLIRGEDQVLYCTDRDGKDFTMTYQEADKFVCQSSRDAEAILDYVLDLEKEAAKCRP